MDFEKLRAGLAEHYKKRHELDAYLLIGLGFCSEPLTGRQMTDLVPVSAKITLQDWLAGTTYYEARSFEQLATYIDSHLLEQGWIEPAAHGRQYCLTPAGEERVEHLLEQHEANPAYLPDLPELLERVSS